MDEVEQKAADMPDRAAEVGVRRQKIRKVGQTGRLRWTGVGYCQTRAALLRLCRASCGLVDPSAWAMLDELPAHIGEMPQ